MFGKLPLLKKSITSPQNKSTSNIIYFDNRINDEGHLKIVNKYLKIKDNLKIYIYNYYPDGFTNLTHFIDETKQNKSYDLKETYKSWLYFIDFVLHSTMYTTDPSIADFFIVPQWENLYKGKNYYEDLVRPLKNATESEYYKNTAPKRNHIFIYISDDTPLSEKRIPVLLRNELKERFIRLSYSGRISGFGKFHNTKQSDSIFNFDSEHEIVVPPGVPLNCAFIPTLAFKKCERDIFYKGTMNVPNAQLERKDALNYMNKNFSLTDNPEDSLFGIHCAGYGIWTARFYNYLNMGIIPILFSDGVIMPFESFFNYKSFSLKVLGSTCDCDDKKLVNYLKYVINIYRRYSQGKDIEINIEEKEVYSRIIGLQNNIREISSWFNWKSQDPYKNPFTLIIIELSDRLNNNYICSENPIAKEEYYDLNSEKLPLYK